MFERFTDRARRVVVMAKEEARLLGHDHVGTEHLLLGLLQSDGGVGGRALDQLGLSLEAARVEVEHRLGRGDHSTEGHIPFTADAKKSMELALRESLQLGHNYIGTEHLLLGVIREEVGLGAQLVAARAGSLAEARTAVVELLGSDSGVGDMPLRRARTVTSSGWAPHLCSHPTGQLVGEPTSLPLGDTDAEDAEEPEVRPAVIVRCDACGQAIGVLGQ